MPGSDVAVILLNWNGWRDTIECMQSILCSHYKDLHIFVCDAGSEDESWDRFVSWATGKEINDFPVSGLQKQPIQIDPPNQVNILPSLELTQNQSIHPDSNVTFIQIGKNLGYAGGNNVGLKFARQNGDFEYFWVLNNDTVVCPDAISALKSRMEEDQKIGICGSTLIYYDQPEQIQTLGGSRYNRWLASSRYILPPIRLSEYNPNNIDREDIEKRMDMVHGAAMFVRKSFIEKVGYMNEEYFLFAEEIDWATRGKPGFRLGFAPKSIVYHKRGRSTGNTILPTQRSVETDYYSFRSRLLFTKKYYPWAVPTVVFAMLYSAIIRFFRGQGDHARTILKVIYQSLFSTTLEN